MSPPLPWRALPPALTPVPASRVLRAMRDASPDTTAALTAWLQQRLQVPQVVLCDSGTSALRLSLERLAGTGPVALPAFGCFDLATAAIGAGVTVRFYDVDPATLTPDLESFAAVAGQGVTAMVVAGLFGYSPPMPALRALCDAHGVALIEDVAQGAGALWEGQPLGRWGDAVVLSFGRGKGIGGAGGGACAFRMPHEGPLVLAPPHSAAGRRGATALILQQLLGHPAVYALPEALPWLHLGETRYHAPWTPRTMHPIQASLALDGLQGMRDARTARAAVAAAITDALDGVMPRGDAFVRPLPEALPGYLRLALRRGPRTTTASHPLPSAVARVGGRRGYPLTLPDLPALRTVLASSNGPSLLGAQALVRELVTVPTHHHVTADDRRRLAWTWGDAA